MKFAGALATGVLALAASTGVQAQSPALDAAFDRFDFPAVEREAQRLLAINSSDATGLIALARLGAQVGDKALYPGVAAAERCVEAHPQNAQCHGALGQTLGRKAVEAGMLAGVRYAGRIRSSFERAVQLAPHSLEARLDLNSYYLMAPALVGGGVDKARRNTQEFARLQPALAELAWAQIEVTEDKLAEAAARLERMPVPEERVARAAWIETMEGVGYQHLRHKRFEDAQRAFELGAQKLPRQAEFARGLGRVAQEQKQFERARKHFDHALSLAPAPDARIYFRLAQVLEQLARPAEALRHYEQARSIARPLPKSILQQIDERIAALRS
ncbi:MAG: tetratricopeptide repeat protein [Betaproteobacteria bacterium]